MITIHIMTPGGSTIAQRYTAAAVRASLKRERAAQGWAYVTLETEIAAPVYVADVDLDRILPARRKI